MQVDYVIIGAGIAGTVLRKFLQSDSVVLLDPKPGQFKIGESIIPEHHQHPIMRALLPEIAKLPSYSRKVGTIFVSSDSAASFPLPPHCADLAMHVARDELEPLMHRLWDTPIVKERVREVDVLNHIVVTDSTRYEVRKQILDCSGPAMVVARSLGDVKELWPVWCRWVYFDIKAIDDTKFWEDLRATGKTYRRFDAPNRRLLPGQEEPHWRPSEATILSEISEGTWIWQIPLWDHKILSFGVVSRHGPVTDEQLFSVAEEHHAAQYTIARRPPGDGPRDKIHVRNHFAQRATTPATMDYILLSDASAFADPIYSVGTGLAVNKAIELAALLNEGGWTEEKCARWIADYNAVVARAVNAFNLWYTGAVLRDDAAAAEAQRGFLLGTAFQLSMVNGYGPVLSDAKGSGPWDDSIRGVIQPEELSLRDCTRKVSALLGLNGSAELVSWQLYRAFPIDQGIQMSWTTQGLPELQMLLFIDPRLTRYYRRSGSISLSLRNLKDGPYPLDPPTIALFDAVEQRIKGAELKWIEAVTNT